MKQLYFFFLQKNELFGVKRKLKSKLNIFQNAKTFNGRKIKQRRGESNANVRDQLEPFKRQVE